MKQNCFSFGGRVVFLTGCPTIPKFTRPKAPVPGWPGGPAYKEFQSMREVPAPLI